MFYCFTFESACKLISLASIPSVLQISHIYLLSRKAIKIPCHSEIISKSSSVLSPFSISSGLSNIDTFRKAVTTLLFHPPPVQGEKKILAKYFYCSIKYVRRSYDAYIIEAINHFYCDLRFIMFQFFFACAKCRVEKW